MIVHNVVQGTVEWQRLRIGMPTASQFDNIITAKKGELSTSAEGYLCLLLAELIMGRPIEAPITSWMERGSELEGEAKDLYAFQNDVELQQVGFVTNDAMTFGASPDSFIVGTKRAIETKVPKPEEHVRYLLTGSIADKYKVQLQGQMYVCELESVDIVSHHPEMPQAVVRVNRDEEFIKKMATALDAFVDTLANMKAKLDVEGLIKKLPEKAAQEFEEFLSNDDVEDILSAQRTACEMAEQQAVGE